MGSFSGFAASDFAPVTTGRRRLLRPAQRLGRRLRPQDRLLAAGRRRDLAVGRHRRRPAPGPDQGVRRGRRGHTVLHRLLDPPLPGRAHVRDPGEHQRPVVGSDHVRGRRLVHGAERCPCPRWPTWPSRPTAAPPPSWPTTWPSRRAAVSAVVKGLAQVPHAHAGDRLLDPLRGGHPGRRRDADAAGRRRLRGHLHGRHRRTSSCPRPSSSTAWATATQYWLDGYDTRHPPQQHGGATRASYFLLQQTPFEVTDARPGRLPGHRRLQRRPDAATRRARRRRARRWPAGSAPTCSPRGSGPSATTSPGPRWCGPSTGSPPSPPTAPTRRSTGGSPTPA